MKEIKTLVENRKEVLLRLKKEKEKALQNVPQGTLRIYHFGNRTQYYHRRDEKDSSGVYMPKAEHDLARKLAQKEYNQKVLRAVERELTALQKYLSAYPEFPAEQIYENLHTERQKLIIPIKETDEQYIRKREDYAFQRKGFEENTPEYYSAKMERVRSKSELIIADLLNKEMIPYRYEAPIYLKGAGQIHPDFTVLNVKVVCCCGFTAARPDALT